VAVAKAVNITACASAAGPKWPLLCVSLGAGHVPPSLTIGDLTFAVPHSKN